MTEKEKIWDDIMFRAQKTVYYSNLVIQQCDSLTSNDEPYDPELTAEEMSRQMVRDKRQKTQEASLMSISFVSKFFCRISKRLFNILNRHKSS